MSAIIQANPLEKLSQEPLPTGDSCVLVIFGASGDLTKRKIIPGLFNLACVGCMNPKFEVLGIGRTPMSSEEFRKKTGEAAAKSKDTRDFSESAWADLLFAYDSFIHDDRSLTQRLCRVGHYRSLFFGAQNSSAPDSP